MYPPPPTLYPKLQTKFVKTKRPEIITEFRNVNDELINHNDQLGVRCRAVGNIMIDTMFVASAKKTGYTVETEILKYPDAFSKSVGLNQLWYKDTGTTASIANNKGFKVRHSYLIASPVPKGIFSFRIPLKHIFGFCEGYDKIVYGLKQTLTLVRKSNDDAIFRDNAAPKKFNCVRQSNLRQLFQLLTECVNVIQFQFPKQLTLASFDKIVS